MWINNIYSIGVLWGVNEILYGELASLSFDINMQILK